MYLRAIDEDVYQILCIGENRTKKQREREAGTDNGHCFPPVSCLAPTTTLEFQDYRVLDKNFEIVEELVR